MDISAATALVAGANRGFGRAADAYEILADDLSRDVRGKLSGGVAALYPQLP
ncbi:hypothetical protein [Micromonospora sp. RTP1Z1]|uniref:hypothetical protein n=1 Tax=Micromonospora sp. RTP1Z1 TaxID=2994043 RepID=UPI0029C64C54|nr:hypothetical protein [Micromonospora sp. RTP1Z1]